MTALARLDHVVEALHRAYPGPGGAAAVLRDGQAIVRHAWGFANAERRIPFTPGTLFRMCSVTKQFTCGLVLDAFSDPCAIDDDVRAKLPRLQQAPPGALHLCHNQSGLRDYWAVAMLHGAPAESAFGDAEAARVIEGARTLHFTPGTRYSYVNQNFRILSDILQDRTGRSFAEQLGRLFDRAGMEAAILAADTRAMPDGAEGYEGTPASGFRAAENRILWTGDAGLGASLDDMIAWERWIDATRDDAGSLYARLSAPVQFADGAPAGYGFGLHRGTELGRALTGHGGALRGWRSHRLHVAAERVSVVVLFNHMADARQAALDLLAAALDVEPPANPAPQPAETWLGSYVEPETGLPVLIDRPGARVRVRYAGGLDWLDLRDDNTARGAGVAIRPGADGVWMDRTLEHQSTRLLPNVGLPTPDIAGRYRCDELDAELTVADAGGALYGAFSGFLGQGRMEKLEPAGPDLWALPCPRALDCTPPGDWTLAVRRDAADLPTGLEVGCWLARRLPYARVG